MDATKRTWFSEAGWALHTANTDTPYQRKKVRRVAEIVTDRASSSAASASRNGTTHPRALAMKKDFAVHTLTIL